MTGTCRAKTRGTASAPDRVGGAGHRRPARGLRGLGGEGDIRRDAAGQPAVAPVLVGAGPEARPAAAVTRPWGRFAAGPCYTAGMSESQTEPRQPQPAPAPTPAEKARAAQTNARQVERPVQGRQSGTPTAGYHGGGDRTRDLPPKA